MSHQGFMVAFVSPVRPIVVVRHPKERRSKCTMQPLRWVTGFHFYNAVPGFSYDATGHLMLALDAPLITPEDGSWTPRGCSGGGAETGSLPGSNDLRPILLLDATWRRLPQVASCICGSPLIRGLPSGIQTAYPRVNAEGGDPAGGLATVEALYVALRLLGDSAEGVLADYRWRAAFLSQFSVG